jgi:hypothetical protein
MSAIRRNQTRTFLAFVVCVIQPLAFIGAAIVSGLQ